MSSTSNPGRNLFKLRIISRVMRVIIQQDYDLVCQWVATYIKRRINAKRGERFVLGLPTGSTPIGIYKRLVKFCDRGELSFANVVTFNMDEYVGLSSSHPQSYSHFMHKHLFSHIDIPHENINLLDGVGGDLSRECSEYEERIKNAGGIDLFLCGMGQDGHLAFNEPGSSLSSRTRVKTLCEDTIAANARFFEHPGEVPRQAITVGVQTILEAKEVMVVATGRAKACALKQCIEGCMSSAYTCTAIQNHSRGIVVADEPATDDLMVKTANYYKNIQKSIGMMGEPIINHLLKLISRSDNVLVTSPHPDDDVIGMGGTMQMFPSQERVTVAYMTNGDGGLGSRTGPGTRIKEAESALRLMGYSKSNIQDLNLPFYRSNARSVTVEDVLRFEEILTQKRPEHIFVCADRDPNGTHRKCYDIIRKAKKNNELKFIWFYTGAWGTLEESGLSGPLCDIQIPLHVYHTKLMSIRLHLSQNPPVVTGGDMRDFVERAIEKESDQNEPGIFTERFKVIDAEMEMPNLCD